LKVAYPPACEVVADSAPFLWDSKFVPTWAMAANGVSISRQLDAISKLHLGFVAKVAS
jgi:hypothetical protein